jgi:transcriptional regulator with XRE-family HTH domain
MSAIKAKESIEALLKQLGLTRTQLAAMLGVSERAVSDWANRSMEDLTTDKGLRLRRLNEVVDYLSSKLWDRNHRYLRSIIEDGRIPMTGIGNDDTASLISYICACPDEKGWRANVDVAFDEYMVRINARIQSDVTLWKHSGLSR